MIESRSRFSKVPTRACYSRIVNFPGHSPNSNFHLELKLSMNLESAAVCPYFDRDVNHMITLLEISFISTVIFI